MSAQRIRMRERLKLDRWSLTNRESKLTAERCRHDILGGARLELIRMPMTYLVTGSVKSELQSISFEVKLTVEDP